MRRCTQCGKCCLNFGGLLGSADNDDISLWKVFKPELLETVKAITPYPNTIISHDIWYNPNTGEEENKCPWLKKIPDQNKYECTIRPFHPLICRRYPVDIQQMIKHKCEMLEEDDLQKDENELAKELVSFHDTIDLDRALTLDALYKSHFDDIEVDTQDLEEARWIIRKELLWFEFLTRFEDRQAVLNSLRPPNRIG